MINIENTYLNYMESSDESDLAIIERRIQQIAQEMGTFFGE